MSRFDDLLTRELERAARPADTDAIEPFERVARRVARRRVVSRIKGAALGLVVITGTVGAFLTLGRAFHGDGIAPAGPGVARGNGLIAYSDKNTKSGDGDIFVMNADGSNVTVLHQPGDDYEPWWSPDGSQIYFDKMGVGLFVMNADGSDARQLTDVHTSWFAISPDGATIAYDGWVPATLTPSPHVVALTGPGSYVQPAIWLMNADGTDPRLLITPPPGEGDGNATWSPNGSQLAFSRDGALWVVNADGSDAHEIAPEAQGPVWSADGSQIAFVTRMGSIQAVSPDGSTAVTLAHEKGVEYRDVAFSPDGSRILFTAAPDVSGPQNYEIYSMDRNGGNVQQLTHVGNDEYGWCCLNPSWQSVSGPQRQGV